VPIAFPRGRLASLQELAAEVIERRGAAADNDALARDLLAGFYELCMRVGLDGVLVELGVAEVATLSDEPRFREPLVARLGNKTEFDARGPRNAKPKALADCLIAVLELTAADPADRTLTMTDALRGEVTRALAGVIDAELEPSALRAAIISTARAGCEEQHLKSFDKIAGQLDERGMRAPQQLRLPLDAVAAVQRLLAEARMTVVAKAANTAIDRAKHVLAAASPDAAARIDQAITHHLTPRAVAIQRLHDSRVPKAPGPIAQSVFDTLSELVSLAWPAAAQNVRPYAVSTTYAVGDVLEHPKFGIGTVKAIAIQRIDVEFPEGSFTLVHARGAK